MNLPQFQDDSQPFQMLQTRWASILNPIISNPMNQCIILPNVSLAVGTNVINHKLGKKLTGWMIVRQRAGAVVYDDQDHNTRPELTLNLVASAPVVVDIAVF